jgi:hypothetical protein
MVAIFVPDPMYSGYPLSFSMVLVTIVKSATNHIYLNIMHLSAVLWN